MKDPTKKAASASRSKKEAAPKAQPIELEWQRLMNEHKNASAKPYSPKTKFIIGDKVKHPSFGDGIVMKLLHPNKIEIVFQMDMKVLIHGGA